MNTLESPFGLDDENRGKVLVEITQGLTEAEKKAFSRKMKRIVTQELLKELDIHLINN